MKSAVLVGLLAIGAFVCTLPPLSGVIHHMYSTHYFMGRINKVTEIQMGYFRFHVVASAMKLGLFELLKDRPLPSAAIAASIKSPVRSTDILLHALVAFDLLEFDGASYSLNKAAREHLIRGQPLYLGAFIELFYKAKDSMGTNHLETIAEAVQNGGSVLAMGAESPDFNFWTHFAEVTRGTAVVSGDELVGAVKPFLPSAPLTALDVAAGSGGYGFTFAREINGSRVTLQDYDYVLEETRKGVQTYGASPDSVEYLPGDFFKVDLKGPYDVVIVSHFLHHFDEATCGTIAKRIAAVLKPGGVVIINDFFRSKEPPTLLDNPFPAIFSVNMLGISKGGSSPVLSEVSALMAAEGVKFLKSSSPFGQPITFWIGRKE